MRGDSIRQARPTIDRATPYDVTVSGEATVTVRMSLQQLTEFEQDFNATPMDALHALPPSVSDLVIAIYQASSDQTCGDPA